MNLPSSSSILELPSFLFQHVCGKLTKLLLMPAEFSLNARIRYAFVPASTKSPALVSRINRIRIVNRAMILPVYHGLSSPLRKRGPSATAKALKPLDFRFRGNEE